MSVGSRLWRAARRSTDADARARDRAAAAAERWKATAERHQARVEELGKSLLDLKRRLREARNEVDRRRRSGLTQEVLAQLLPLRARHRPRLPGDEAAAAARERCLIGRSDAYRSVLGDDEARKGTLARTIVDGLPWWIPMDDRVPERLARASGQGLPLRAILQTREVSLGGVMLDIGANIGRTSIPRVLLGDVRAVYAAEPEPANFSCLVQNVIEHDLRGTVLPDRVALGRSRGEVLLRRSRYPGGHRVLQEAPRKAVETVTVPQWTMDEWVDRVGVDAEAVSFVKIDTQGSEVSVLLGAASLIDRPHVAWQIEVDPALLTAAHTDVRELVALVAAHFSHFIDIGTDGPGPRVRATSELASALDVVGGHRARTDIVAYHAAVS